MMKKRVFALLLIPMLIASLVACSSNSDETKGVYVSEPWVRASEYSDHVGGMTGVFMNITNNTASTITLIGGTSTFALMVQTHQVVNGMMSEKPNGIEIKPGQTVTLEPGGLHVMLMNLTKTIVAGTKIDLTLKFEGTADITLDGLLAKTIAAGDESYSPTPMPEPPK